MEKTAIRALRTEEIKVVAKDTTESGTRLLLYKDGRVDMTILDEIFGPFGWTRRHPNGPGNCVVSVRNPETGEWVEKEDFGYVEPGSFGDQKALASDSFKRACTNIGIGRELYTAPRIYLDNTRCKIDAIKDRDGNFVFRCQDSFSVTRFEVTDDRRVLALEIVNQKGTVVFTTGSAEEAFADPAPEDIAPAAVPPEKTAPVPAPAPTAAPESAAPAPEEKAPESAPAPEEDFDILVAKAKQMVSPIGSHRKQTFGELLESDFKGLGGALAWILTSRLNEEVKGAARVLLQAYYPEKIAG